MEQVFDEVQSSWRSFEDGRKNTVDEFTKSSLSRPSHSLEYDRETCTKRNVDRDLLLPEKKDERFRTQE